MTQYMTRQEAIQNLLQDEHFSEVIKELRDNQLNRIIYSAENDSKDREQAYIRIKTIDELMAYLQSIAKDAEIKDKAWKIL